MASKGPKVPVDKPVAVKPVATKPVVPVVKAAASVAARPADAVPPALAAKPVPRATPAPPVAKPIVAKPAPVAPKPVIAVKSPVAAKPVAVAPPPVAVAAAPVEPEPALAAAPEAAPVSPAAPVAAMPVPTPQAPAAAPAVALTQKEDIMEATFAAATDKTQAMFADVNSRAKTAMEKGSKLFEDMGAFSKGNLEALVESSKIAAKGTEEIARYTSDYAKASVEKANAAAKQLAAVKSPTELFKLQGDFAKEAMDQMMAETAKFTENYLKLLGEIAQPLSNRVAVAAEKMKLAA